MNQPECQPTEECYYFFDREQIALNIFPNSDILVVAGNQLEYDFTKLHCADGFNECLYSCCNQGKCQERVEACDDKLKEAFLINSIMFLVFILAVLGYLVAILVLSLFFDDKFLKMYNSDNKKDNKEGKEIGVELKDNNNYKVSSDREEEIESKRSVDSSKELKCVQVEELRF